MGALPDVKIFYIRDFFCCLQCGCSGQVICIGFVGFTGVHAHYFIVEEAYL